MAALTKAADNIRAFHSRQLREGFRISGNDGYILGQKITPIAKAGIYVPGGTASYPSTVLMDAIPAKLAGVDRIVMVTPPGPDGRIAYCTRQNGYQIAVYDPRTGQEEIVSAGPDHEDPSWAPDGRHIICSRKEGASSSLCILDTKDKSEIKVPLRPGNWRAPDWSRPMP